MLRISINISFYYLIHLQADQLDIGSWIVLIALKELLQFIGGLGKWNSLKTEAYTWYFVRNFFYFVVESCNLWTSHLKWNDYPIESSSGMHFSWNSNISNIVNSWHCVQYVLSNTLSTLRIYIYILTSLFPFYKWEYWGTASLSEFPEFKYNWKVAKAGIEPRFQICICNYGIIHTVKEKKRYMSGI